jgi:uncharacterized phage-associated protein
MNFPFNASKITEAAKILIQMEGGKIEVLKLIKLLYISERESFRKRGGPIYGGKYYSLPHGPITSEGLNLMDGEGLKGDQAIWDAVISPRDGNWLSVVADPEIENLSRSELGFLQKVYEEHGHRSAWELRCWCHKNIPEYEELKKGRLPITLKEIGLAVDFSPEIIAEEARMEMMLCHVFAS